MKSADQERVTECWVGESCDASCSLVLVSSVAVKLLVGIEPSPLNWPLVRLKTTKSVESAEYQADLQNERHHCMYPARSSDGPQSLQAGC